MADKELLRRLWLYKSDLEEQPDEEKLIQIFRKLYKLPITISSLKETGIGKIINNFKTLEGASGEWANKVITTWKHVVQNEVKQQVLGSDPEEEIVKHSADKKSSSRSEDRKHSEGHKSKSHSHRSSNHGVKKTDFKETLSKIKVESDRGSSRSSSIMDTLTLMKEEADKAYNTNSVKSDEDLTDSDEEPEGENDTNISDIENYYKEMLEKGKSREAKESKGPTESNSLKEGKNHSRSASSSHHSHHDKKTDDRKDKHKSSDEKNGDKRKSEGHNSGRGSSSGGSEHKSHKNSGSASSSRRENKHDKSQDQSTVKEKHQKRSVHEVSDSENADSGDESHPGDMRLSSNEKLASSSSNKDQSLSSVKSSTHSSKSSSQKSSSHQASRSSGHLPVSSSSHSASKLSSSNHSSKSSSHPSKSSSSTHHSSKSSSKRSSHSLSSKHSSKSSSSKSSESSSHHSHDSKKREHSSKKSSGDNGNEEDNSEEYVPTLISSNYRDLCQQEYIPNSVSEVVKYSPTTVSGSASYSKSHEYVPSKISNSPIKKESSDSNRENEEEYDPGVTVKKEKMDTKEENCEYIPTKVKREEDEYEPQRVVKTEKEEYVPSSKHKDSSLYTDEPTKVVREEDEYEPQRVVNTEKEYVPSSKHKDSSLYADEPPSTVIKNKYLSNYGRSDSSGSEMYSPTHHWQLKQERTDDDDRYGGKNKKRASPNNRTGTETNADDSLYSIPDKKNKKEKDVNKHHACNEKGDSSHRSRDSSKSKDGHSKSSHREKRETEKQSNHDSRSSDGKTDRTDQDLKRSEKSRSHSKDHMNSSSKANRKEETSEINKNSSSTKHSSKSQSISSSSKSTNSEHGSRSDKHSQLDKSNKESSSHQKTSKEKPSHLSSKDKDSHKSTSSSSKPSSSTSSSSSKKASTAKQPKPKIAPAEPAFDLFSDAIHIKAEPASPKPRPEKKKRPQESSKKKESSSKSSTPASSSASKPQHSSSSNHENDVESCSKEKYRKVKFDEEDYDGGDTHMSEEEEPPPPPAPSTHKKKKTKEPKCTQDESQMSFEDFMNIDSTVIAKKGKSKSSTLKASGGTSGPRQWASSLPPSRSNSLETGLTLPPPPKNNVSISELDILGLLPETQATYRPLRANPLYQDYEQEETDVSQIDPDLIGTKNKVRYKVYSGRKHGMTEMKSLYDQCMQVLIDHGDEIDYVGGVPYSIMKPVLERRSPQQLYMLEEYNPHFLEDSDELWEIHCQRDFTKSNPDDDETWRELYVRRTEERESKYQKLREKMSSNYSNAKGQTASGRTARLAYVDTMAKPPREVLRQQKRFGTGCIAKPKHRPGTSSGGLAVRHYRPSLAVQAHNPLAEPPRDVRPMPPMMARALQMRKNMRR